MADIEWPPMPTNPAEATRLLWALDHARYRKTQQIKSLRDKLPDLMKKHRKEYARALGSGQGSVEDRKKQAEAEVVEIWGEIFGLEQSIESCRDELREMFGRAEDLRSINSNLKEELRTLGSTHNFGGGAA